MNRLVILTGKSRSGKDTSLIHLQYLLHLHKQRIASTIAFAKPLKTFCMDVLGLTYEHCYGETYQKNSNTNIKWSDMPLEAEVIAKYRADNNSTGEYLTGREVMEIVGSYICRKMFPECWAKAAEQEYIRNMNLSNVQYFITDCRFPNEIEVFKKYNPLLIRLHRNIENRQAISEIALDSFDWDAYDTIHVHNNNLSLEDRNRLLEQIVLPRL